MSTQNPPVWERAEEELARLSQPTPGGNTLVHTMLINGIDQALNFAQAHLDQARALHAQLRSVIGA